MWVSPLSLFIFLCIFFPDLFAFFFVFFSPILFFRLQVDLMAYLVDAACHPEWGADEAVADLLVAITLKNISIPSLNSLCGLFKGAVQVKATANAANKLILFWIDKTRTKKWVINVQEKVLNLLFTMLVNKSSDSEDDTVKVLEYFKNQFVNMRAYAAPAMGLDGYSKSRGGRSVSERTARQCILTCALDCLAEIKRSAHALRGGATVALEEGAGAAALTGTSPVATRSSLSGRRGSRSSPGSMLQRGASSEG